jgi:glutamate synthase domain-containing protein 3
MKGVSYITDEKNHKKSVIIDLKNIEKYEEEIHEFIDVLVAESRKDDELISWEDAKKQLKKKHRA